MPGMPLQSPVVPPGPAGDKDKSPRTWHREGQSWPPTHTHTEIIQENELGLQETQWEFRGL